MIADALYNPLATAVKIGGTEYPVQLGRNNCRFLTWDGKTFMQESPTRPTKHGRARAQGHQITWVMRTHRQKWGLIVNGEIERP